MFPFNQKKDTTLFNEKTFTLKGLNAAYQNKDERLSEYIYKTILFDPAPASMFISSGEGNKTYLDIRSEIDSVPKRLVILEEQKNKPYFRKAKIAEQHKKIWDELEALHNLEKLPERLRVHSIILKLWNDDSSYAREQLIALLYHLPLVYGPWRAIKHIFKEAAQKQDWEVFLILATSFQLQRSGFQWNRRFPSPRFLYSNQNEEEIKRRDHEHVNRTSAIEYTSAPQNNLKEVSRKTIDYLIRRSERELNRVRTILPDMYVEILAQYFHILDTHGLTKDTSNGSTLWLIRYQQRTMYGGSRSWYASPPNSSRNDYTPYGFTPLLKQVELLLAQNEEKKVDFLPTLYKIFESIQDEQTQGKLFSVLKEHYPDAFRELPLDVLLRMAKSEHKHTRNQVYLWFSDSHCGIEQARFHEKGYHQVMMCFLGRDGEEYEWNAKQFAIDYLTINKEHIGDTLDIGNLLWMFGHEDHRYRNLADLLLFPGEGDSPFFSQLTLEVYTNLLENTYSFTKAKEKILREEWSDRETNKIDVQWFVDRFESEGPTGFLLEFAFQKSKMEGWNQGALAITRSEKIEDAQVLRFALNTLNKKHDGTSFLSTFAQSEEGVAYIRRLLLHPHRVCAQQAISWVEEESLIKALGVEFLKELCHGKDTIPVSSIRSFVGGEPLPEKELEDIAIRLITPKAQSWLTISDEYTYKDIGWEYIDTYTQNFGLNKELSTEKKPVFRYKFLRTFMKQKVPLTFGDVDVQGVILERLYNARNFDSPRNQFYLKLLRSRHDVANKVEPASLAFKKEDFSFEKFVQWAKSKKPAIREFSRFISTYQMSSWVEQGLGFADFTSTLELPYLDIQSHIHDAFFVEKDHSYIDIQKDSFTVSGLFSYCFNKNNFVQKIGLELLNAHPKKFGDPEQLFLLADSKNPVVRELVIQTLWKNHRNTALRDKWFPYPDSVAPISIASEPGTVLSPARHLTDPNNIDGLNPEDVKGTHKYLGPIYTASSKLKDEHKEGARKFFRTMLLSLPSYPGTEPAVLKNSSWRNKTTLIHAMRDVALKDEDFAEVIAPIIRNFQSIKAKKLKEACLSTLIRLEANYPNNNNLTYPYIQGGE